MLGFKVSTCCSWVSTHNHYTRTHIQYENIFVWTNFTNLLPKTRIVYFYNRRCLRIWGWIVKTDLVLPMLSPFKVRIPSISCWPINYDDKRAFDLIANRGDNNSNNNDTNYNSNKYMKLSTIFCIYFAGSTPGC